MNAQQELQKLSNQLDKKKNTLLAAEKRFDHAIAEQARQDIASLSAQIAVLKKAKSTEISSKGAKIKTMKFSRPITKAEQADMGKLKKKVKGLVVVHPLTALGRELGVSEVTGYANKAF